MISPNDTAAPAIAAPAIDLDLVRKYSIPGPRYTSYPPATQFSTVFEPEDVEKAIINDNQAGAGPISLYFHLPFCETRCWFCGCTTVITRRRDSAAEYLDILERELQLTAARMNRARPVTQIHLGGGTPTFLPADQLRRLGAMIHDLFNVTPDAEFSVEVDPRRLTLEHVAALQEIGARRASLGVQDTNARVQLAIHRFQPHTQNRQAFAWLRDAGFDSINVDLIHGLPLQTVDTFAQTLDDVLELSPDRLSVFSYAHVPWIKPAQRIFDDRGQLPSPEEKLAMFALAHARLTGAGYLDIGLDHFARPTDELARAQRAGTLHRNFQGYSTQAGASLYGFGMSSISQTPTTFRQNHKTLPAWREAVLAGQLPVERTLRLSAEDQRRRTIIMGIMCDRRLDFRALSTAFGVNFPARYATELASLADLEADGLVAVNADGLEVLPAGVPLLRVIATRFDAYLSTAPNRHSKTI